MHWSLMPCLQAAVWVGDLAAPAIFILSALECVTGCGLKGQNSGKILRQSCDYCPQVVVLLLVNETLLLFDTVNKKYLLLFVWLDRLYFEDIFTLIKYYELHDILFNHSNVKLYNYYQGLLCTGSIKFSDYYNSAKSVNLNRQQLFIILHYCKEFGMG